MDRATLHQAEQYMQACILEYGDDPQSRKCNKCRANRTGKFRDVQQCDKSYPLPRQKLWTISKNGYALGLTILWALLACVLATDHPPIFTKEPDSVIAKESSKIILQCDTQNLTTIEWLINGRTLPSAGLTDLEIQDGRLLIIPSFRRSRSGVVGHDGTYRCVATNRAGSVISREARVDATYTGEFYEGFKDMFINVTDGNVAFIPCAPPSGRPRPITTFELNGTEIDLDNAQHTVLPSGNLQIRAAHPRHNGRYRCIATNPLTNERRRASNVVHLNVRAAMTNQAPVFRWVPPTEGKVERDANLTLECVVEGAPVPVIMWSKYGGKLPEDRHRQHLGNLVLYNVNKLDEGTYICSAHNGVGPRQVAVGQVDVLEPPVIQTPPSNQIVAVGGNFTVDCTGKGQPEVTTSWYHDGQELLQSTPRVILSGTSLTITPVRTQDRGIYQCFLQNSVGSVSAVSTLSVVKDSDATRDQNEGGANESEEEMQGIAPDLEHVHPFITSLPRNKSLAVGGETTIACPTTLPHVDYGENFLWLKNSHPIEGIAVVANNQSQYSWRRGFSLTNHGARFWVMPDGLLQIFDVQTQDSGEYMCVIWEQGNSDSATAYLTVVSSGGNPARPLPSESTNNDKTPPVVTATGTATPPSNNPDIAEIANERRNGNAEGEKNGRRNRKNNRNRNRGNQGTAAQSQQPAVDEGNPEIIPPSKPLVSKLSDTSVMLEWTLDGEGGLPVTFFKVQYKELFEDSRRRRWRTIDADIPSHIWQFEVSGLKPGSTYRFRIVGIYANNDNMHGPNSRKFTMESGTEGTDLGPRTPVMGPVIVEARPTETSIKLKWQYLPDEWTPVDGFNIYYQPYGSTDSYQQEAVIGSHMRETELKDLMPNTMYSIRMKGYNSAGESDFSNVVVKRTSDGDYQYPDWVPGDIPVDLLPGSTYPPGVVPSDTTTTTASGVQRRNTGSSNKMLYMILGCVLGALVLFLVLFMGICAWKQRRRAAMLATVDGRHKYQDPARTIYAQDSIRLQHMNGNGFLLNGLGNGMQNGHLPSETQPQGDVMESPASGPTPSYHGNGLLPQGERRWSDGSLEDVFDQPPPPPPPLLEDDHLVKGMRSRYDPNMSSFQKTPSSSVDHRLYSNTTHTSPRENGLSPASTPALEDPNSCQGSETSRSNQGSWKIRDPMQTDHVPRSHERLPLYHKGDSFGRAARGNTQERGSARDSPLVTAKCNHRRRKMEDETLGQHSLDECIPLNETHHYSNRPTPPPPILDTRYLDIPYPESCHSDQSFEATDYEVIDDEDDDDLQENQPLRSSYDSEPTTQPQFLEAGLRGEEEYSDDDNEAVSPMSPSPSPPQLPRIPRLNDYPATDAEDE